MSPNVVVLVVVVVVVVVGSAVVVDVVVGASTHRQAVCVKSPAYRLGSSGTGASHTFAGSLQPPLQPAWLPVKASHPPSPVPIHVIVAPQSPAPVVVLVVPAPVVVLVVEPPLVVELLLGPGPGELPHSTSMASAHIASTVEKPHPGQSYSKFPPAQLPPPTKYLSKITVPDGVVIVQFNVRVPVPVDPPGTVAVNAATALMVNRFPDPFDATASTIAENVAG